MLLRRNLARWEQVDADKDSFADANGSKARMVQHCAAYELHNIGRNGNGRTSGRSVQAESSHAARGLCAFLQLPDRSVTEPAQAL